MNVFDDVPAPGELPPPERGRWPGQVRRDIDGPQRGSYVALRKVFREQCAAAWTPCHVCNQPIDYRLKHGDPWAWELDHLVPVIRDPSLALVVSNFRASHSVCNKRRGLLEGPAGAVDDEYEDLLGEPSEAWFRDVMGADGVVYVPDIPPD